MTMKDERSRAIINARQFLRNLLDPKKTPRVPRDIRRQAYYVLKHYPFAHELYRYKDNLDLEVFKKEYLSEDE